MSRHLTIDQIEQYRQGTVTPAALLEIDDHLASCDACRAMLRDNVSDSLSVWASGLGRFAAEPEPTAVAPPPTHSFVIPRWAYAAVCGVVLAAALSWQTPDGRGTVYSTTVVRRKPEAGGDYNVAPEDRDVWSIGAFAGSTHVTAPERAAVARLGDWGLTDLFRLVYPDADRLYTYWDYRSGDFHQHRGMRIDLALGTAPLAERTRWATVDRNARKGQSPSDHAPLIVDLAD